MESGHITSGKKSRDVANIVGWSRFQSNEKGVLPPFLT